MRHLCSIRNVSVKIQNLFSKSSCAHTHSHFLKFVCVCKGDPPGGTADYTEAPEDEEDHDEETSEGGGVGAEMGTGAEMMRGTEEEEEDEEEQNEGLQGDGGADELLENTVFGSTAD